jgi:hypothetical protein
MALIMVISPWIVEHISNSNTKAIKKADFFQ